MGVIGNKVKDHFLTEMGPVDIYVVPPFHAIAPLFGRPHSSAFVPVNMLGFRVR